MRSKLVWVSVTALWVVTASAAAAADTVAVPEPTSFALLAAALGGVALTKFRRRK